MSYVDKEIRMKIAEAAAKRFLETVETVRQRTKEEGRYPWTSKETGACRRASMDLTRALADFRRPA